MTQAQVRTTIDRVTPAQASRFWTKVQKTDTCWIWTAYQCEGYGRFGIGTAGNRTMACAHRVAWELVHGPVPDGLELDHLCRNPSCVNPDHLEPVTHQENVRRGLAAVLGGQRQRAKTHCPQGHPYDERNTYRSPATGKRQCRCCRTAATRRYQDRKAV